MTDDEAVRINKMIDSIYGTGQPTAQPAGDQRPTAKPADIHSAKYINDDPAQEFAKATTKDTSSLIGRTRTDNPDDYNIFGTKKAPYMSDFIDHSGYPRRADPEEKNIRHE